MTSPDRPGFERLGIATLVWLALGGITLTPFFPGGMMTASACVMIVGLWAFFLRRWHWQERDNPLAVVNAAFALFALGSAAIAWSHGDRLPEMEQYLPFLAAVLLGIGFRASNFPAHRAALAAAAGAAAGAAACLWQVWSAPGMARAEISMHSTWLGTIGALYAVLCASGATWADIPGKQRALLAIGALAGTVIALLSGSKGSWLVLAAASPFLLLGGAAKTRRTRTIAALLVVAGLVFIAASIPNSPVIPRIKEMAATGDRLRSAYWQEASSLFRQSPLLGGGREALREKLRDASLEVRQGIPLEEAPNDAHNEYLDILATRGITGLALALSALAVPFAVFWSMRKNPGARGAAHAGMLFIFAFAVAGLTDVQFAVNMKRMLYLFTVLLLLATATAAQTASATK